ncbi:MAG: NADH-quinone oxidoreductase subunit NuoH [Thermodesulfobacteriota bacterium]
MMTWGAVLLVLVKVLLAIGVLMTIIAYMTLMERKVLAFIQVRYGPNRVGPWGLLQPLADGIKLLFKEEITVAGADKFLYLLAPAVVTVCALIPFAVVPFGKGILGESLFGIPLDQYDLGRGVLADLNVGILFVFAISSLGVYGVVLAGWSSNNKYSLLGGVRSSAQMISYELSLGLSVVGVLILSGTLSLVGIVEDQDQIWKWNCFRQPLGFLLFLIAGSAEVCRTPFDFIECDNELVAGYQTEYSSMKFGLFYLAEYGHLLLLSSLLTTLFLGGWQGPVLPPFMWFAGKVFAVLFFFIWVRGTYPRLRYDRLMQLGWKVMLPAALFNIMITALVYTLYLEFRA